VVVRPPAPGFNGRPGPLAYAIAVLVGFIALGSVYVSMYTDLLWFREAGHGEVYTSVLGTKVMLFVIFGLLMGVTLAVNLVVAYRIRPPFRPVSLGQQNLEPYRVALERFLLPVTIGVSALFGLFAGIAASSRWQTWLLWRNGQQFGVNDPQFGRDISYFAFTYPFQRFLLGFIVAALVVSLIGAAITHYLFGGVRLAVVGERVSVAARVHLSVLVGLLVLLRGVSYWLDRYGLAFSLRGVVQGASYTDVNAVLPAKTMLAGIAVICALLFFANVVVKNLVLPGAALGLMIISAVVVGGIYPAYVQQFQVKPNEVTRETPYLQRNIDATRVAYQIDGTQTSFYPAVSTASKEALRGDKGTLPNARLLDPNILGPTFKRAQGIRNYFNFNRSLDIDRYTVDGKTQDYVVAVREIDQSGLRPDQKNWINERLTYTHGNGFVAAPANRAAPDGLPMFAVKDIPQTGPGGEFAVEHSQIYFGENSPSYSIVDTNQPEIDGPGSAEQDESTISYDGPGGVKLDSGFRKLLYALKFQEKNILLSSALTKESKIMYTRSPLERVGKVAPFLKLDSDPYPAVVDGQLLWIVDGYTTSAGYPYAQRTQLGETTFDSRGVPLPNEEVNYIRNSVKATLDAYTGEVRLYTWDEKDPVLKAWKSVFPGLVLDKSMMSESLRSHVRYPEDFFKVQRELLGAYHVTNPTSFYNKEDFWQVPADPTQSATQVINNLVTTSDSGEGPAQPPYYALLQMPGRPVPSFSLTSTFVARGASNLTAFAAVSSDPADYGTIRILTLPKSTVIPGPGLVANAFEGNTEVSTKLSLLRGGGSSVVLGNLLTLPVGNGLLYIEPVYTQAKKEPNYPILNSVIVSFGDKIAYKPTLAEALDALFGAGATPITSPGPGSSPSPTSPPPTSSNAITSAQQAYDDMQAALRRGDFKAYGEALERLKAALDMASPAPSPSR
jgi:hypothetical protein